MIQKTQESNLYKSKTKVFTKTFIAALVFLGFLGAVIASATATQAAPAQARCPGTGAHIFTDPLAIWCNISQFGFDPEGGHAVAVGNDDFYIFFAGSSAGLRYHAPDGSIDNGAWGEAPIRARTGMSLTWTGEEILMWGGRYGPYYESDILTTWTNEGWAFSPTTKKWRSLSNVDAPSGRAFHHAFWSGSRLIIAGGAGPGADSSIVWAYDPKADHWEKSPSQNFYITTEGGSIVQAGNNILFWGGFDEHHNALSKGARYSVINKTWSVIPTNGAPTPRADHSAVWTGRGMVIWGGSRIVENKWVLPEDAAAFDLASNTWHAIATTNAPAPRQKHSAVWTGQGMLIFGGMNPGRNEELHTALWIPDSNSGAWFRSSMAMPKQSGNCVWPTIKASLVGGCPAATQSWTSTYILRSRSADEINSFFNRSEVK